MANITKTGTGEVVLIAGGDKCYTDIAARFCHSNRSLDDILATPYDAKILNNILKSGHFAATEFDYFIFGISGFARVTEVQMVRNRIASYLISSGRDNRHGKRKYDVVLPESLLNDKKLAGNILMDPSKVYIDDPTSDSHDDEITLTDFCPKIKGKNIRVFLTTEELVNVLESWYDCGVDFGIPEDDLRYMKPQGTAFKAIIGMNARELRNYFNLRCCQTAMLEHRHLAYKMLHLCQQAMPDMFKDAGAPCKSLGYCPQNDRQADTCKGKVITQDEAKVILDKYARKEIVEKPEVFKYLDNFGKIFGGLY